MRELKRFKLYNYITDELIMEGTMRQIADFTGMAESNLREAADRERPFSKGKYLVLDISKEPQKGQKQMNSLKEAAENWEKFAAPIREKYGIPVYRAKPEVRG